MTSSHRAFVATLSIAICAGGCRSNKKQAPPPPPPEQAKMVEPPDLSGRAQALAATVKLLPGRDAASDRKLVADAFDRAASALSSLAGPEPTGALRQQLRIIDTARETLRGNAESVEPATDSGLRAIQNALLSVRDASFTRDNRIGAQVNTLRQRIDELDNVHGPLHSLAVAQAFASVSDTVSAMSSTGPARAARQPMAPAR